jgi:ethanolamine ammonia-lyase small subunit
MNSWLSLKKFTTARVGLGRSGHALPTKAILEFQLAHAQARSAVLQNWNYQEIFKKLDEVILVSSQALNREDYLKFPNKGRYLDLASTEKLQALSSKILQSQSQSNNTIKANFNTTTHRDHSTPNITFIISDGLSAHAIQQHFLNLWVHFIKNFETHFTKATYHIVLVPYGRVAISDQIGELLNADLSVIFIGERPGLNSADSLGIYLTYNPKVGNSDAQRNCISNVRPPNGLSYETTSFKLNYLIQESLQKKFSGVHLKDECNIQIENDKFLLQI